jgi:hypothetical protein
MQFPGTVSFCYSFDYATTTVTSLLKPRTTHKKNLPLFVVFCTACFLPSSTSRFQCLLKFWNLFTHHWNLKINQHKTFSRWSIKVVIFQQQVKHVSKSYYTYLNQHEDHHGNCLAPVLPMPFLFFFGGLLHQESSSDLHLSNVQILLMLPFC